MLSTWTSGANENHVAYSDVCEVRLSRRQMRGEAIGRHRATLRCHLRCRSGPRVTLSPLHYVRFRRWEDRSTPYAAFVGTLLRELRNYNPDLKVSGEVHWTLRLRHRLPALALGSRGLGWRQGNAPDPRMGLRPDDARCRTPDARHWPAAARAPGRARQSQDRVPR